LATARRRLALAQAPIPVEYRSGYGVVRVGTLMHVMDLRMTDVLGSARPRRLYLTRHRVEMLGDYEQWRRGLVPEAIQELRGPCPYETPATQQWPVTTMIALVAPWAVLAMFFFRRLHASQVWIEAGIGQYLRADREHPGMALNRAVWCAAARRPAWIVGNRCGRCSASLAAEYGRLRPLPLRTDEILE
jgi:hypothetical protein